MRQSLGRDHCAELTKVNAAFTLMGAQSSAEPWLSLHHTHPSLTGIQVTQFSLFIPWADVCTLGNKPVIPEEIWEQNQRQFK